MDCFTPFAMTMGLPPSAVPFGRQRAGLFSQHRHRRWTHGCHRRIVAGSDAGARSRDAARSLMSRKPVQAQIGDRSRLEIVFDKPQLLGRLFGEYDQNLVAIENRLGVYIAARGNKLQIEGEAEAAARARDVMTGLY